MRIATLIKRLRRTRAGATAVEFAFVAPLFLIMVLGVIEMSRAMWIKSTMQFAVDETARFVIVNTSASSTTLETYAQTTLTDTGMDSTGMTFDAASATISTVTFVTITATYNFTVLIGYVPFPDITLTASSRIPIS